MFGSANADSRSARSWSDAVSSHRPNGQRFSGIRPFSSSNSDGIPRLPSCKRRKPPLAGGSSHPPYRYPAGLWVAFGDDSRRANTVRRIFGFIPGTLNNQRRIVALSVASYNGNGHPRSEGGRSTGREGPPDGGNDTRRAAMLRVAPVFGAVTFADRV